MAELSANFLYAAFLIYLIAVPVFGGAIRGTKGAKDGKGRWSAIGITLTIFDFFVISATSLRDGRQADMRLSAICLNLRRHSA